MTGQIWEKLLLDLQFLRQTFMNKLGKVLSKSQLVKL